MLVNMNDVLYPAKKGKYAVGLFNAVNLELARGIIAAAENMGADAIHPGFGFLSENSEFVRKCKENGITFIGPPANVIAKLGNKQEARNTMEAAGVPVIPGSKEPVCEVHTGLLLARYDQGFLRRCWQGNACGCQ